MNAQIAANIAQVLGSDYVNIRPLGEDGGLSSLFRATKQSLNIDVVVKRMRVDQNDPASVKREAEVLTSLRHQYLPRIFDFAIDAEGYSYTIVELIAGCTLRQYIQKYGALNQKLALKWIRQICEAIQYMHSQKPAIIHSDIKPENIMITNDYNVCLIDFNASLKMRGEGQQAVGATACYAAPEQYNVPLANFGDPQQMDLQRRTVYQMACEAQNMGSVTCKTDIFAIGAVAYFMMTGYDPPAWNQPQVPLTRYAITLSDPLRQLIERCMEREPSRRFASAKELHKALDGLAYVDQRYKSWRRSCRAAALVTGAGIILSVFCCIWGGLMLRQNAGSEYVSLVNQAQVLAEQQDYEGQQQLLLEAIQLDAARPEAYANLGALLYQMGDYRQAIDLLAGLDPNEKSNLNNEQAVKAQGQIQYVLASCYYGVKDYAKALSCYQLAAGFCPDQPAYQRDLAICYAKLGYDDKASKTAELLLELGVLPGDVELVNGEIAYAAGRFEDAFASLEKAVSLAEDHSVISRASLQAAECCTQLGNEWADKAIDILQKAARRLDASENAAQMKALSDVYIQKAAIDSANSQTYLQSALDCLNEVIQRGQPTFAVMQNTGIVLEYLGREAEAEEIFQQMKTDYPNDYRPCMQLALLYYTQQSRLSAAERSYDAFKAEYEQAEQKYAMADTFDGAMERLREFAAQLPA